MTEEQIERYARQIILPEVGGRGQARLLGSRVAVAGDGDAAATALTLLGRAGVGTLAVLGDPGPLPELSPDCRVLHTVETTAGDDVVVDLTAVQTLARAAEGGRQPVVLGTRAGACVTVVTLVGRPCVACLAERTVAAGASAPVLAAPVALALGALAAAEALRVVLVPPGRGRRTVVAVDAGTAETVELGPTDGCPRCGSRA